jgi:hypothetical protein
MNRRIKLKQFLKEETKKYMMILGDFQEVSSDTPKNIKRCKSGDLQRHATR